MDQEVIIQSEGVNSFRITVSESTLNTLAELDSNLFRYGSVSAYSREGFTRTKGELCTLEVRLAAKQPQDEFTWRRSTAREAVHICIDLSGRVGDFKIPKAVRTSCCIYSLMNYLRKDYPAVVVEHSEEGYGFSTMYESDFADDVPSFWVRRVS